MSAARFWAFGLVGAVMIGASIALVAQFAFGLAIAGSCSSTGYAGNRRVPTCSGDQIFGIVAIFPSIALGLLGLWIAGRRAPRGRRTGTLGIATWSVGYLVLGGALVATAFDPSNDTAWLNRWGWALPGLIFLPLSIAGMVYGLVGRRRVARTRRLAALGIRARGTIVSVEDTGMTVNMNPRLRIEVDIQPPSGAAYRATKTAVVPRIAIPRAGEEVEVWIDPSDPNSFTISLAPPPAPGFEPGPPAGSAPAAPSAHG